MIRALAKRVLPETLKFRHERLKARLLLSTALPPPRAATAGGGRHVTLVTTGRNDDYMPDFARRLRSHLAWNLRHAAASGIFVEWNPPSDRPLLSPDLCREFPGLRAYVVTPETHSRVCRNPHLQLMEYHAKNVGIRRAQTDFILACNADIYVGPELCRFIHRGRLAARTVYLARRVDICWSATHRPWPQMIAPWRRVRILALDDLGPGDFLLTSRAVWEEAQGYDESLRRHRLGCDGRGVLQMRTLGAAVRHVGSVFHMDHATSSLNAIRPWQGEVASLEGIPYSNPPDWGLRGAVETPIAERVWRLG